MSNEIDFEAYLFIGPQKIIISINLIFLTKCFKTSKVFLLKRKNNIKKNTIDKFVKIVYEKFSVKSNFAPNGVFKIK